MTHALSLLCLLLSLFLFINGETDRGAISYINQGSSATGHIAGGNGGVTVSGSTVTLLQQYAPRVYLMNNNGQYFRFPNLLGKTISFTINLATSTCGCNAAFYFVEFPSSVSNYYCDAQCPNGLCCTEIDVFEANTHAVQVTAHCGAGDTYCKWGCGINWKSNVGYGPGGSKINTNSPFKVEMSFVPSGASLHAINVRLSQNSNTLSYSLDDSKCSWMRNSYISGLTSSVTNGNLVLAISYWGGDMNWLDGCSGSGCPASSTATFSNIQILSTVTVSAMQKDTNAAASSDGFVGSPGFYAVIGIAILIALIAVVAIVVVYQKNTNAEFV